MKHLFSYTFILIFLGLFFNSCQKEDSVEAPREGLFLSIQPSGNLSTRATETTEGTVNTLTVLYFRELFDGTKETGNSKGFFLMDMEQIATGTAAIGKNRLNRPFTVWKGGPGKTGTPTPYNKMRVAVFANLPATALSNSVFTTLPIAVVDNDLAGDPPVYDSGDHDAYEMTKVLKYIQVGNATNNAGSAVFSAAATDYIPMFVETGKTAISINPGPYSADEYIGGSSAVTYALIRMLAKVSIVNDKVGGTGLAAGRFKFKIKNASILKGNSLGYAYFDIDNRVESSGSYRMIKSNVPINDPVNAAAGTSTITVPSSVVSDKQTFTPFYMYEAKVGDEAAAGSDFNYSNHCHIVVEGFRNGDDENDNTKLKKYMIPFPALGHAYAPSVSTSKVGSVLRNHHYQFTIVGVNNYGLFVTLSVQDWTNVVVSDADPILVPETP